MGLLALDRKVPGMLDGEHKACDLASLTYALDSILSLGGSSSDLPSIS
jgi:hypothetical protein